jgi:hypothetical protein
MTHHIAPAPAGRPRTADLVRATAHKLSDRVHAAADDRARNPWAGPADQTV